MGDYNYNWDEILKGTNELNYSLRSFETFFVPEDKRAPNGLSLPDTYSKEDSRIQWLEKCKNLEQKTVQIFTPELMVPFRFSLVRADFVYGLIKKMRNLNEDYKGYCFDFDLKDKTVSSVMDLITSVREVHSDEDRLFDVFEANGWKFKEVPLQ